MQGVKIPSDEKVNAIIKGLDFDSLQTDQIRTLAEEDRRRHDGWFRGGKE